MRLPFTPGCRTLDPVTAARLHPSDRRRVIRALEVIEQTGEPLSRFRSNTVSRRPSRSRSSPSSRRVRSCAIASIAACLRFFEAGFVDEVRALMAGPRPLSDVAAQAIGYREVIAMLAGQASLDETIERIQARTRQFAKRQATWFRGLEEVESVPVSADEHPEELAERLAKRWRIEWRTTDR